MSDDDRIRLQHMLDAIHFDINLDILWRTVQDDLPPLVVLLQNHLFDR